MSGTPKTGLPSDSVDEDRSRGVALFRFSVVRDLANLRRGEPELLAPSIAGRLVRGLASCTATRPAARPWTVGASHTPGQRMPATRMPVAY